MVEERPEVEAELAHERPGAVLEPQEREHVAVAEERRLVEPVLEPDERAAGRDGDRAEHAEQRVLVVDPDAARERVEDPRAPGPQRHVAVLELGLVRRARRVLDAHLEVGRVEPDDVERGDRHLRILYGTYPQNVLFSARAATCSKRRATAAAVSSSSSTPWTAHP